MGRLAQTLAISVEASDASKHRRSKVMPTATSSRLGCKYKIHGHLCALEPPGCNPDLPHRMYWLALRAGVLRRAVSQRGTARERGARFDLCAAPRRSALACQVRQRTAPPAATSLCVRLQRAGMVRSGAREIRTASSQAVPPKRVVAFPSSGAINVLSVLSFSSRHCWLTNRSTGHFAAVRVWPSIHSWPNTAHRKVPVSSNVRPPNNNQWRTARFLKAVNLNAQIEHF